MRTGMLLAVVLATTLALHTTQARAADCDGLDAKIAAAKTAAEHEAVAACYDGMAKDTEAKLAEHKKMRAAYEKAGPAALGKFNMVKHCDQVIASLQGEAQMYADMAKAHREMAKRAK